MIKDIIAYNATEIEKRQIGDHCKMLFKSKLLSKEQYVAIETDYTTSFFSPSIVMRILLFLGTFLGVSAIIGPIVMIFGEVITIRFILAITGIGIIIFCEIVLIRVNHHFRSGVTEATIYIGASFLYFGMLGFDHVSSITYITVGLVFTVIMAIRYLDRFALLAAIILFGCFLFEVCLSIGEVTKAALPFVFIVAYLVIFLTANRLQKNSKNILLVDHFILLKSISLIIIYIAGNYFVVRELSQELMGLQLAEGEDIPLGWLFIGYTLALPIAYLLIGLKIKSILFIRIALLVFVMGVATFKMYFSLAPPAISITIGGTLLICVSLLILNYLKSIKNGFTRDKILNDKWDSEDLSAYIISQASVDVSPTQHGGDNLFEGGEFGGGGAGGSF